MIRYNIILLWAIYIVVIFLLSIIDTSIILYYIFWIFNVFIYPLFWLMLKIIFYNRAILLLLLFYYLLAKYTIDIGGYKYFYFFGLDINKYYKIYYNYIWNMTAYHIEMISIFLFFIVIIGPLFYFNKEILLLLFFFVTLLIILRKVYKSRLVYYKNDNTLSKKIGHLIFLFFFIFIFFKVIKYPHINNAITLYFHFDIWVYNLLEWKIEMYKKTASKDIYTTLLGLQPQWYSLKEVIKDKLSERKWDYYIWANNKLKLQEKFKIEFKIKNKKKNYLTYYKSPEWFKAYKDYKYKDKKKHLFNKFMKLKYNKKKINYKKDFKTWQFASSKKPNESIVVTKEKRFERNIHKSLILRNYFLYSLFNYYELNKMLNLFTIRKDVYKETFHVEQNYKDFKLELKKKYLYMKLSSDITQSTANAFDKVLKKIEKNKEYFKESKLKKIKKNRGILFSKIFEYMKIEKTESKLYNIKRYHTKYLFIVLDKRLIRDKEYIGLDIVKKYASLVLYKDNKFKFKSKLKTNTLLMLPKSLERKKVDNDILLETLNKYEIEKKNANNVKSL